MFFTFGSFQRRSNAAGVSGINDEVLHCLQCKCCARFRLGLHQKQRPGQTFFGRCYRGSSVIDDRRQDRRHAHHAGAHHAGAERHHRVRRTADHADRSERGLEQRLGPDIYVPGRVGRRVREHRADEGRRGAGGGTNVSGARQARR